MKETLLKSAKAFPFMLLRFLRLLSRPVTDNLLFCFVMLGIHFICVWRQGQYEGEVWLHAGETLQDLYLLGLILLLLPRRIALWFRRALYALAYILAGFEVFLSERFDMLYTPTTLQLLSETTGQETKEFFEAYLQGTALWTTLALFLGLGLVHFFLNRLHWPLGQTILKWIVSFSFPALFVIATISAWTDRGKQWDFFMEQSSSRIEKVKWQAFYNSEFRLAYSWHTLRVANGELNMLRRNMRNLKREKTQGGCPNIVLIIGESYNKYHSQLYGYRPQTTPLEKAWWMKDQLVIFHDVVTCWNMTSNVFKNSFSTHSTDQKGSWCRGVLFPALMRKADYRVAFLTNQFEFRGNQETFDFNGSFFLNNPELDSLCFDFRNKNLYSYDGDMLGEYEKYKPGPKNLVIFHLYGQHQKYSKRAPKKFHRFNADSIKTKQLNKSQRQTVADYNNATLYNDWVIDSIYRLFKDKDAIVIYLSDHGEEVMDGSFILGRTPAEPPEPIVAHYEFGIPFTIWYSQTFRRKHPAVVDRIWAARHKPFMNDDLPHIIMGLAGIKGQFYDPKRDLLSPDFNAQRKRLLKRKYNYDELNKQYTDKLKPKQKNAGKTDKNKAK